jgi:hypothetical protein
MKSDAASDEKKQPSTFYILDCSKLETGDVILTTVPDSPISKVIRATTQSAYSHAALIVLNGSGIIEAIGSGVEMTSPLSFAVRDVKNIKILRIPSLSDSVKEKIETSLAHLFKDYSTTGALLSVTDAKFKGEDTELFCSQLVAQTYLDAGVSLCEKPAAKVTPADLDRSLAFQDITPSVLIKSSSENSSAAWFEYHFVEDGSRPKVKLNHYDLIKSIVKSFKSEMPHLKRFRIMSVDEICMLLTSHIPEKATGNKAKIHSTLLEVFDEYRFSSFPKEFIQQYKISFNSHHVAELILKAGKLPATEVCGLLRSQKNIFDAHTASINTRNKYLKDFRSEIVEKTDEQYRDAAIIVDLFWREMHAYEVSMQESVMMAIEKIEAYLEI